MHALDTSNPAIKTAVSCEKVVTLLNHLRENHKDTTALVKLQKTLNARRRLLNHLKFTNYTAYSHVIRLYGIADLKSVRGEEIHKKNFHLGRLKSWLNLIIKIINKQ